jgi:hypothetical protein
MVMYSGSSHRLLAQRRDLLLAASALTLSFSVPALGKAEWLITADEIEAARKALHQSQSAVDGDESEVPRKALQQSDEIGPTKKTLQGAPSSAEDAKPSGPSVLVLKPIENGQIKSPVDFDIRFVPVAPASINPSSIKIIYSGLFDITDRIREYGGKIDAAGIVLSKAPLKPDAYRVTIAVTDSAGRTTRRAVRFTVL